MLISFMAPGAIGPYGVLAVYGAGRKCTVEYGNQRVAMQAFADVLVCPLSSPIERFLLSSDGATCELEYRDGLHVLSSTFQKVINCATLGMESVFQLEVMNSGNCVGMPPTTFVCLSRVWRGYHAIITFEDGVRRRVTGWTVDYGGAPSQASCALALVASGEKAGSVGYLLWGSNGGLRIGGTAGYGQPVALVANLVSLSTPIRSVVSEPPTIPSSPSLLAAI